ncbi:MAG: PEP-CTERM sorting domain-containing protein [Candidatus Acidiferrales bacterium]
MKKTLSVLAILTLSFCFAATNAKADGGGSGDVLYTITGPSSNPITVTFELPVNPTIGGPDNYDMGFGFQVEPIDLTVNGVAEPNDCLFFYNVNWDGGFEDNDGLFSLMNPAGVLTALYSGSESDPTMLILPGPITLNDFESESGDYTLTVSTVPEPTSLMLLATGILALCLARKFRTA